MASQDRSLRRENGRSMTALPPPPRHQPPPPPPPPLPPPATLPQFTGLTCTSGGLLGWFPWKRKASHISFYCVDYSDVDDGDSNDVDVGGDDDDGDRDDDYDDDGGNDHGGDDDADDDRDVFEDHDQHTNIPTENLTLLKCFKIDLSLVSIGLYFV